MPETKEKLIGITVAVIGVIVVLFVGYIVIQQQVIAIRDYCQELINNHTIQNMSECNVTIQAMAEIRGENISRIT